jgi:hypothetical protein
MLFLVKKSISPCTVQLRYAEDLYFFKKGGILTIDVQRKRDLHLNNKNYLDNVKR